MLALLCAAAIGQFQPLAPPFGLQLGKPLDVVKMRLNYEKAEANYVRLCETFEKHSKSMQDLLENGSLDTSHRVKLEESLNKFRREMPRALLQLRQSVDLLKRQYEQAAWRTLGHWAHTDRVAISPRYS